MSNIKCAEMGTFDCYVKVSGITSCDRCLATEVKILNELGIKTIGCCCGHGIVNGYIQVTPKHCEKMKEIGYEQLPLDEFGNGPWCFAPKSILLNN